MTPNLTLKQILSADRSTPPLRADRTPGVITRDELDYIVRESISAALVMIENNFENYYARSIHSLVQGDYNIMDVVDDVVNHDLDIILKQMYN
jgi:hypothetical protein